MGNRTSILLYLKLTKHPVQDETPQYLWKTTKLVSGTRKHEKSLIKVTIIWKNYYNIRTILVILGNGTFMLLYSKVLKHLPQTEMLQYQLRSHDLLSQTFKRNLKNLEKLPKYQNNPGNIEILDFHSTIFQGSKTLLPKLQTSISI